MGQVRSSSIDVTIVSAELALVGRWDGMEPDTMGSDHAPIITKFGRQLIEESTELLP